MSLTGLPNPPFLNLTVTDTLITVTDNNQNNGAAIDYPYVITVCSNGVEYSSAGAKISGGEVIRSIKTNNADTTQQQ